MFTRWWPTIKFFIVHAKAIAFAGIVWWLLAALTLDVLGLIDIEVDCAICGRLIDRVIPDAMASDGGRARPSGLWCHWRRFD